MFIAVGALGGFVRALYGMFKAVNIGREINILYFITTVIISGIIGGLLGIVFNADIRVAALAGYVGTDILENIFKGTMGKSIILKKK